MSPTELLLQTDPPPDAEEPSRPLAPAAHPLAMTELDAPRPAEASPLNGSSRPSLPFVSAIGDAQNPLRHVKATLTVCVGAAELTVGELLAAREQQVLRLDRSVEQPVDLLLEGHVVARGILVAVDDHFAVRITELPVPLDASLVTSRKP